jgi:hypothetical protein
MARPHTRTTAQRGYGQQHRKLSEQMRRTMQPGTPCSRCGQPMYPEQSLHLDHDDHDRTQYRGLSHAHCNIAARNQRHNKPTLSTIW